MWSIPAQVERHLRQTSAKVAEWKALYGSDFSGVVKKVFSRELARYQLIAVNHLLEQGVENFKDLSSRKLTALQLTLGLLEKKLPKTLARLEELLRISVVIFD